MNDITLIEHLSVDSLTEALQEAGYRVNRSEQNGVVQLLSASQGIGYAVRFGNPAATPASYLDFTFSCALRVQGELPAGLTERWNLSRRFGRLSQQGEFLVMEMDVIVAGGVSPANLRSHIELWDRLLEASAAAPTLQPFQGAIDELRLSKIARPAALLLADATAQGAESRLVAYGVDEKQSGFGFGKLGFLLNAVPLDAWVIIAILALMMVQSWVIMYRKNQNVGRVSRANGLFRERFAEVGTRLELLADDRELAARLQHSSLWRLYQVAVKEIRTRREQGADTSSVSAATIEAIRASMDGVRTKENQQLGSRLSSLSNAIAGGPYIGLLGTVLGIMVVFLGTAMAGDVNINAIAPGMAAALLATAMGLFVAIPALFGYNRLVTRNKEVSADMRVFVDEFVTRLAEVHGESQLSEVAHRRNGQPLPA